MRPSQKYNSCDFAKLFMNLSETSLHLSRLNEITSARGLNEITSARGLNEITSGSPEMSQRAISNK